MISTESGHEEWLEERRVAFEEHKKTLTQVPTAGEKKEYIILCYSKDDWKHIHEVLMQDGTLEDNIPSNLVEGMAETKGTYTVEKQREAIESVYAALVEKRKEEFNNVLKQISESEVAK